MRAYTRQIPANDEIRIAATGRVIFMRAASTEVIVTAQANELGNRDAREVVAPLSARQKLVTQQPFDDVTLRNTTASAVDLEVLIGFGDYEAPLAAVSLASPNGSTQGADSSMAANTTESVPANASRTRLVIESDVNNTVDIRVGTSVSDVLGLVLTPGAQQTFHTTQEVFARNILGAVAAATWRYFEEEVT